MYVSPRWVASHIGVSLLTASALMASLTSAVVAAGSSQAGAASVCIFNGQSSLLTGVTPAENITIACTGLPAQQEIAVLEASPLAQFTTNVSEQDAAADLSSLAFGESTASGTLLLAYTLPKSFAADDPSAVCPPTQTQINTGLVGCTLPLFSITGTNFANLTLQYAGQPTPQPPTLSLNPTTVVGGEQVSVTDGPSGNWWGNPTGATAIQASDIVVGGIDSSASTASVSPAAYDFATHVLTTTDLNGSFVVPCSAPSGSDVVTLTEPNTTVLSGTISASAPLTVGSQRGPYVGSLSPSSGPSTGGTTVIITGCNFTGARKVTFGGRRAESLTVNSATSITAVSPPGRGIVSVVVSRGGHHSTNSAASDFTYDS